MTYTTKHLKTDSYEDFYAACESADLVIDGEIITSSHNHSMILVGTLYEETGQIITDDDGNEYPEKAPLDGYHVNLRYKESIGLETLEIEVSSPTVCFGDS